MILAFARHSFEHLEQTPALSRVTFCRENTFSFEVHVIDQRVATARGARYSFELFLDMSAIGLGDVSKHFRKCFLQAVNEKFRLKSNRITEELPELFHDRRLACRDKFRA